MRAFPVPLIEKLISDVLIPMYLALHQLKSTILKKLIVQSYTLLHKQESKNNLQTLPYL